MTDLVDRLRDLSDAYQDLLSQHEELSKRFADMKAFADAMEIKRDKAADEIERLRAALSHYANQDNWREVETTDPYLVVANDFDWNGDLGDNPWDIAKEALQTDD